MYWQSSLFVIKRKSLPIIWILLISCRCKFSPPRHLSYRHYHYLHSPHHIIITLTITIVHPTFTNHPTAERSWTNKPWTSVRPASEADQQNDDDRHESYLYQHEGRNQQSAPKAAKYTNQHLLPMVLLAFTLYSPHHPPQYGIPSFLESLRESIIYFDALPMLEALEFIHWRLSISLSSSVSIIYYHYDDHRRRRRRRNINTLLRPPLSIDQSRHSAGRTTTTI